MVLFPSIISLKKLYSSLHNKIIYIWPVNLFKRVTRRENMENSFPKTSKQALGCCKPLIQCQWQIFTRYAIWPWRCSDKLPYLFIA